MLLHVILPCRSTQAASFTVRRTQSSAIKPGEPSGDGQGGPLALDMEGGGLKTSYTLHPEDSVESVTSGQRNGFGTKGSSSLGARKVLSELVPPPATPLPRVSSPPGPKRPLLNNRPVDGGAEGGGGGGGRVHGGRPGPPGAPPVPVVAIVMELAEGKLFFAASSSEGE